MHEGAPITGLCVNDDRQHVFFATPTENKIVKIEYSDDTHDYGKTKEIYADNQETSWVNGVACNDEHTHQIFWFNTENSTNLD